MRKTIKHRSPSTPAVAPPAASTEPQPAQRFQPRGQSPKGKRILVAVTEDRIDFKAMDPEAAKKLNELLHTPEVQAQFGIGPLTDRFDPAHCKRIYEALGHAFQTIARVGMKWPASAAAKLAYTEQEKDELAKPTAQALDELAPRFVKENQAILALLLVFAAITQNKFQEGALELQRLRGANLVSPEPRIIDGRPRRPIRPATPPPAPKQPDPPAAIADDPEGTEFDA